MSQQMPPPEQYQPYPQPRPGGLTALAVLNFVFGGLGVIGAISLLALGAMVTAGSNIAEAQGVNMAPVKIGMGILFLLMIIGLVASSLLIVSGVGYIKQKKFLGYTLGTAYACVGILNVILNLALIHTGFGFMAILGLAYPVVTLALLNTAFKNSFPNP